MHTILLIGAGNIGRRHLQGILLAQHSLQIHIIEPFEPNRNLIEQAVTEAGGLRQHTLQIFSSLDEIEHQHFEIVIIATSADVRKNVLIDFLSKKTVTYLVLEKVLFQTLDDYKTVGKLLYEKQIKTFVNCTRRYFPHYQQIKKAITGSLFMEMKVSGSNWGLACNTIHLLDLFNYFNDNTDYHFEIDGIDKQVHSAKRKGFIELTGTIKTAEKDLFQFSAASHNSSAEPLLIQLKTNRAEFIINETEGKISCRAVLENEENKHFNNLKIDYKALPLSQSANLFVDDLLNTGTCLLTDYFVSAQLHTALIKAYLAHLKAMNFEMKNEICPIT